MQTILKGECRIGACATCAAFEIVMTCSKPRFETKDLLKIKNKAERRNMMAGRPCRAKRGGHGPASTTVARVQARSQ